MMKSFMKFAAAVVAAALMTACFAADDSGDKGDSVDWIKAENGRREFREGFGTADATLAAGFVATGIKPTTIVLTLSGAEYHAVLRKGRYYSGEGNPDDSKDIPASAEVFDDNKRRLFASKGYKYLEARTEENAIIIRYYRGVMGCGIVDYHLQPNNKTLTITKEQIISTKDYTPCSSP